MIRVDNIKGQELYKSLGFTREAILVDEYICPKTREYVDMIRMYKINPKTPLYQGEDNGTS